MSTPHTRPTSPEMLHRQIDALCQSLRALALAYGLWVVYAVVALWSDRAKVIRHYGAWLRADLTGITDSQRLLGFLVHAAIAALVLAVVYCIWRLTSGFLAGRIFTPDSARWIRRIGVFGLGAEIADILARPLISVIVTLHRDAELRHLAFALNPNDLAFLMFLLALIALGHIHKKAAEMAEENAGIV